jgi:hypothetical protein
MLNCGHLVMTVRRGAYGVPVSATIAKLWPRNCTTMREKSNQKNTRKFWH